MIKLSESDSSPGPDIGQIVLVRKGREYGQIAVIIQVLDERFVLIADGEKRKFDRPKKKNIQHLERYNYISPEVRNSIKDTGRVSNNKLRMALWKFAQEVLEVPKKGDGLLDGER